MCMSVAKEAIRKETGKVNDPLECWGLPAHPSTIWTGSTPTGTAQIIWTHKLRNVQSNKFKSMPNKIQKWEGTLFTRLSNM